MNRINKRGLSEMVSYVLLVIIAIGIGSIVFVYLQVYVPKDKSICPDDTSIIIERYSCQNSSTGVPSNLSLTLKNNGLFTLNAVYIRVGPENREVKDLINDPRAPGANASSFYLSEGLQAPTTPGTVTQAFTGLRPGSSTTRIYHPGIISQAGNYGIEIQPAVGTSNKLTICEKATIVQTITCT